WGVRRRVDLVLLGTALAASFATGVLGLWVSERHAGLVVWAHGAAGMAVIALVWSKLGVVRRGLRRRWPEVGGSLAGGVRGGAARLRPRPLGGRRRRRAGDGARLAHRIRPRPRAAGRRPSGDAAGVAAARRPHAGGVPAARRLHRRRGGGQA